MVAPSSYFKLPERKGRYQHPDLHIAQAPCYYGKNWNQTRSTLTQNNQLFLPPYLFRESLILLRSGKTVYNEHGKRLPKATVTHILNEITEQRDPWRGEWLGAKFTQKEDKIYITHLVFDSNGNPQEKKEPLDKNTLMKDKLPGISLDEWLKRAATTQGLPSRNIKERSLWYWYPRNESVARFRSDSVRAGLDCTWGPRFSIAGLGVRPFVLAEGGSKIFEDESKQQPKVHVSPSLTQVLSLTEEYVPSAVKEQFEKKLRSLYDPSAR